MKLLFLLILSSFLMGCASSKMVIVDVNSEPQGAQVDVNGITIGKTPTRIELQCVKTWVGLMYSPDGWSYSNSTYELTVYPSASNPGQSQTKRINPCQWKSEEPATMTFDIGLKRVTPTHKFDININKE